MTHYPDIHFTRLIDDPSGVFEVIEDCYVRDAWGDFIIPRGFKSNMASVPKILWPIIPPHGKAAIAAIAHDYRYTSNMYAEKFSHLRARLFADLRFYEDMVAHNVPLEQASTMYHAVRWFGKGHWEKARLERLTYNK